MMRWLLSPSALTLFLALGVILVQAQQQESHPPVPRGDTDAPAATFQSGVTLMTTVVIPRDRSGVFLPDLTAQDFLVFEDDSPREVVSLVRVLAGRAGRQLAPPLRLPGGVVLPPPTPPRAPGDAPGRLFVILVDDLSIEADLTARTRELLQQLAVNVIHDGDLFGIVSTGPSSIAIDVTSGLSLKKAPHE